MQRKVHWNASLDTTGYLDIDFYLLPLEGYEVVLGAQWLRTLEMIEWDFSKLLMRFQYGGKRISL